MRNSWYFSLILLYVLSTAGCDNLCFLNATDCDPSEDAPALLDLVPKEGLLAFYPFDGNAKDATSGAFHGVVSGAVQTSDRFGNLNSAYQFDGVDDYIDLGDSSKLKPPFPLSIAMWVRVDQIGSSRAPFTNSFDVGINTGAWIAFASDRGRAAISFGDGGPAGRTSRRTKIGATPLEEGRWYHVVGVIRNEEDMSVFIDGRDDGGEYEGPATSMVYGPGPVSLGRRYTGQFDPPVYFQGAIDELALYNKALTVSEVQQLFTAGSDVREES